MLPSFDLNVADPVTTRYRRTHNTPVHDTEARLNALYGAWRIILCGSGMEAVNSAFALIRPQTVITDSHTYFETRNWLTYIGVRVVQLKDLNDLCALEDALRAAALPCVVCSDSPSTFGKWLDIKHISELAHHYHAIVIADNSVASLYYSNPIKDGADIVVESYTKYVCGHGDCFAGGIALSHSMRWLDEQVIDAPMNGLGAIDWILSRWGNVASPFAAYAVARGLETIAIRMERHTANARRIADRLKAEGIETLYSGAGGLITLPGYGEDFCRRLRKFVTIGTFGCTYSCCDFFRSADMYSVGTCARLSVGLEDPEELLDDVMQALKGENP